MSPEDFHKIALPLLSAVLLTLIVMGVCAVLLIRQGAREKAQRRQKA
jgi:hypothetical protein